ncbi:MAG: hypothetical protein DWQ37_06895 [Planctomycetota bacterium]|nr:MAG: hypothetical protein DWQ37_06895 [Planctomycetota bacterium]
MTLEELQELVKNAAWFSRIGIQEVDAGYVQISSLDPWAGGPSREQVADEMDWLPSSRDQVDPIHAQSLEQKAQALGKEQEYSRRSLIVYKETLGALRSFDGHPLLRVGPHDFTEAARGAAIYAARRAAYEILLGVPGFWCQIMQIYKRGHWPCGILPDGQVVVL